MHQLGNIWQDRFGLMHAEYLSVMGIIPPFVTGQSSVDKVGSVVEISDRTVQNHRGMAGHSVCEWHGWQWFTVD